MHSMRIGLIAPPWTPVPPPLYGGIELVVDELARGIQAAGPRRHPVHHRRLDLPGRPASRSSPRPRACGSAWPCPSSATSRRLRRTRATATSSTTTPWPARLLRRRPAAPAAPPVVTTVHGPLNDELIDLYRALGDRVPIICISEAQHRAAPHDPRWPGSSTTASTPANFTVGDGQGDADGPYCLFLGRMSPDKGAHRAIAVARKAGMRILMAAKMREAWEIRYFTEMVEPLLGPDAVYLGEVPHERKLELLEGATALVFPIRWNEPFGMVMLEAMACGTPVLAFPEGAAPEVVVDGKTGFLCDDEAAMTAALGRIGEIDRADCRAAVEGYFSTGRMVADHLALFESLRRAADEERGRAPWHPSWRPPAALVGCAARWRPSGQAPRPRPSSRRRRRSPIPSAPCRAPEYGIRFCPGGTTAAHDLRVPSFDRVPLDADVALPATGKRAVPAHRPAARAGGVKGRTSRTPPTTGGSTTSPWPTDGLRRAHVHGPGLRRLVRHGGQSGRHPGVRQGLDPAGRPALRDPRHPVPGRAAGRRGAGQAGHRRVRRLLRRRPVPRAGRAEEPHAPARRQAGPLRQPGPPRADVGGRRLRHVALGRPGHLPRSQRRPVVDNRHPGRPRHRPGRGGQAELGRPRSTGSPRRTTWRPRARTPQPT